MSKSIVSQYRQAVPTEFATFADFACPPASLPPSSSSLETSYAAGNLVNFGDNITYSCKQGFYFEEDIEMANYSVICHDNGTLSETLQRVCVDPKGESLNIVLFLGLLVFSR